MKFYDVYPLYDIEPVRGLGCKLWDKNGKEYLDLFGGHGVISIGHSHPYYLERITSQIEKLIFYSNSFVSSLKEELARLLGKVSGCEDFDLFLCNSGAEAVENALKVASFYNGRKKVLSVKNAFHGRTTAAIAATDTPKLKAPINNSVESIFIELNNSEELFIKTMTGEYCAVIIEGIQGVGGINLPDKNFLETAKNACEKSDTVFIIDEIQSGYGRTGKFFAHQFFGIEPDIITIAKGMANGIPAGGVLISRKFEAKHGMLGSTFGGNQLACAGGIAVLEVIQKENLIENAQEIGEYLIIALSHFDTIKEVRGRGLMLGIEFGFPIADIRNKLMYDYKILTGSSGTNIIRLLPPLCLNKSESNYFLDSMKKILSDI